jgi:hypothetical protein
LGVTVPSLGPAVLRPAIFSNGAEMWIKTENGWRMLQCVCVPAAPEVPWRNPFRCWEMAGAKSFRHWLGLSG